MSAEMKFDMAERAMVRVKCPSCGWDGEGRGDDVLHVVDLYLADYPPVPRKPKTLFMVLCCEDGPDGIVYRCDRCGENLDIFTVVEHDAILEADDTKENV